MWLLSYVEVPRETDSLGNENPIAYPRRPHRFTNKVTEVIMEQIKKTVKTWAIVNHARKRSWRCPEIYPTRDEAKANLDDALDTLYAVTITYFAPGSMPFRIPRPGEKMFRPTTPHQQSN